MTQSRSVSLLAAAFAAILLLSGCASSSKSGRSTSATSSTAQDRVDGPPISIPSDLSNIPDAQPRDEPLHRFANRPYTVFGVNYTPMTTRSALTQNGMASWYGRKFHGQKTAIGETYDMLAMTAAHPTAPLPSFARVTNTRSGQAVVVRINDRGPFHANRIIDLSYAAAHRIGIAQAGSAEVRVELLLPPYFERSHGTITAAPAEIRNPLPDIAVATSASSADTTASGQQFFIQLGAFGNFANAQQFQQRMESNLSDLRSVQPIAVRQRDGLFRVQIGPLPSAAQAQSLRAELQTRLGATLPLISESVR
ncbi:MAG: septal ring lytic transglycosylase RlpA family protein [Betaproteobacteria bacterium]|nr:MAG: septal ring lytic transglycosylase RlpA family protein [Betaproteobacteria bacterium]TAG78294.1 MAG: septal ring lytic transglycosylase RlpA family protein [Betaproteobacteria bacterium]